VEVLIVIVIIAVAAAIIFSFVGNPANEARHTADATQAINGSNTIAEAVNVYYLKNNRYPDTLDDWLRKNT